jgi:hypothetical protein
LNVINLLVVSFPIQWLVPIAVGVYAVPVLSALAEIILTLAAVEYDVSADKAESVDGTPLY